MNQPTPEELAALRVELAPRVREVIDAQLASAAMRASDVDAALAQARTRRRRVVGVGVPAALAAASLAAFALVRTAPPAQDVVRISYVDHGAPGSTFTIDLVIQGQ